MNELRGLIVDYGGVLTNPLVDATTAWASAEGVDYEAFAGLMRRWLGPDAIGNPVHELESGRLSLPEFERLLAAELGHPAGHPAGYPAGHPAGADAGVAAGLVKRLLGGLRPAESMVRVVANARASGIRTALLSNSWGLAYPREGWAELFDAVVISGEVGMRKPEPDIYLHTAQLLGLPPAQCVFVDDFPANVRGARAVGMVGIHHADLPTTVQELEILFDRELTPQSPG